MKILDLSDVTPLHVANKHDVSVERTANNFIVHTRSILSNIPEQLQLQKNLTSGTLCKRSMRCGY
jgi:hypothetical protein